MANEVSHLFDVISLDSPQAIPSANILGVCINTITMDDTIAAIEGWIDKAHRDYACLCNVHSIMEANDDPHFKKVLNSAGLRAPDGLPLVWISKWQGHEHVEHVRGADLMLRLCARSEQSGHRHYFYGGAEGVVEDLAERLTDHFPGLQIAGLHTPRHLSIGELEDADTIAAINAAQPDIIWVGLGCPKQEWWAARHRPLLEAPVLLAVGAAFDFNSGTVHQAPRWMQRIGLEWCYRLAQDPVRLWRRYTITNSKFLSQVLLETFNRRRANS